MKYLFSNEIKALGLSIEIQLISNCIEQDTVTPSSYTNGVLVLVSQDLAMTLSGYTRAAEGATVAQVDCVMCYLPQGFTLLTKFAIDPKRRNDYILLTRHKMTYREHQRKHRSRDRIPRRSLWSRRPHQSVTCPLTILLVRTAPHADR